MGNSYNGGQTPNFGHLVGTYLFPRNHQNNLYVYGMPDGQIWYVPFSSDWNVPQKDLIVAIFRCKEKKILPVK